MSLSLCVCVCDCSQICSIFLGSPCYVLLLRVSTQPSIHATFRRGLFQQSNGVRLPLGDRSSLPAETEAAGESQWTAIQQFICAWTVGYLVNFLLNLRRLDARMHVCVRVCACVCVCVCVGGPGGEGRGERIMDWTTHILFVFFLPVFHVFVFCPSLPQSSPL